MLISSSDQQNLSPIPTDRIKDTTQLEARIYGVWLMQQKDKEDLKESKIGRNFSFTSVEEDWANILLQLQPEGDSSDPVILELRGELEGTEISLRVFKAWISSTAQARMRKASEGVITKADDEDRMAEKIFYHLVSHEKQPGFNCSLNFLQVVWESLGADDRKGLISRCAAQLLHVNELYEALPDCVSAGAELKREITFGKFLNGEKIEGYAELKGLLERFEQDAPDKLLEMVAYSKFDDLKRKAWGIWLNQFNKDKPGEKRWMIAARLIKEADENDAAEFYKSGDFLPGGLVIYEQVYARARKSSEDLVVVHQRFMEKYPALKEQRVSGVLAKAIDPTQLKRVLDDLENGTIGDGEVWRKVLEKVAAGKPEMKQRALGIWCRHCHAFTGEGLYGNIWLEAIKLVDAGSWVEFFCGPNFAAALPFFNSDSFTSIYKSALIAAKRSDSGLSRIVKAHLQYVNKHPILMSSAIFEISIQLATACLKSNQQEAYQLVLFYAQDPQADQRILMGASQWLLDRLDLGQLKKAIIPAVLELANVLLELSDRNPGSVNCVAMAERLTKKAFYGVALRYAFKALYAAAKEDLDHKANQHQLDYCFDLMTAIVPHVSDRGFSNLLEREKVQDFQSLYNQKMQSKWAAFWTEMALRSLALHWELGLAHACDFWRIIQNPEEKIVSVKLMLAAFAILPVGNEAGIENYEEKFTKACAMLSHTFQGKITKKIGDEGAFLPVLRPLDIHISHLCMESVRNERHSFLLLTIACNIVKDPKLLKEFMETEITTVVANSCLKKIECMKEPSAMDTPEVQSFLQAAREHIQLKEMQDYYQKSLADEKKLTPLMAIHAPALYKVWLEVEKGVEDDFLAVFDRFNEEAYSIFIGSELAVQKLVWKFAVKFALKHDEDVDETVWAENLQELMGWLDEMLAPNVVRRMGRNRISLSYLDSVIEICDFAAPLLYKLALEYKDPVYLDEMLSALIKMAELQINCRSSTPELKRAVFLRIVKIAVDTEVSNATLDKIIQFAMDAERSGPQRQMTINKVGVVKIDQILYSTLDNAPILKRKGVRDLFNYLLRESRKNDSFVSLQLAGQLLNRGRFEAFQNEEHCGGMMKIFHDVFKGMQEYEESEVFKFDIFINVFYALMHQPVRGGEDIEGWVEYNSLDELLGTSKPECKMNAYKRLNEMIVQFFAICGSKGENLTEVSSDRRSLCLKSFDNFLKNCETKHYLEPADLEKWKAQFASLKKQIDILE